ncbi:MAG: flagellar assembly protein FliW [Myxococcales bacterium]|nr:flagellar assembly protein FliW [Myxococcales bacterium]
MSGKMQVIETTRFGRLEVDGSEAFRFGGVPGFPNAERFVLMEHDHQPEEGSVFAWMISLEIPDLAFVVADPWQFFPDYRPPLEPRHLKSIGVEAAEEFELLAMVSFQGGETSLNLAAPILINSRERIGAQVILEAEDLSVRQAIPPVEPAAAAEDGAERTG